MIDNYKVVVVTPAGRKKYLELLIPQIKRLKMYVDEYRLWVNTTNVEDIQYMEQQASQDPGFITLEYLTVPHRGNNSICSFFKNCVDTQTIYVRFDDDIVLLDDPENFKKFIEFRIAHPEYFLVYGNILNNSIVSHLQQRFGKLNMNFGLAEYSCMGNIGWNNSDFALNIHEQVVTQPLSHYHFDNIWDLFMYERVSINCISWLGSEFAKFSGNVGIEEEQWLSCDKPFQIKKINCIFGGFVCVHYVFHTQREKLDASNILEKYKKRIMANS
jgi:hypothetical protein